MPTLLWITANLALPLSSVILWRYLTRRTANIDSASALLGILIIASGQIVLVGSVLGYTGLLSDRIFTGSSLLVSLGILLAGMIQEARRPKYS